MVQKIVDLPFKKWHLQGFLGVAYSFSGEFNRLMRNDHMSSFVGLTWTVRVRHQRNTSDWGPGLFQVVAP